MHYMLILPLQVALVSKDCCPQPGLSVHEAASLAITNTGHRLSPGRLSPAPNTNTGTISMVGPQHLVTTHPFMSGCHLLLRPLKGLVHFFCTTSAILLILPTQHGHAIYTVRNLIILACLLE